ncbi:hypothetical protein DACRYDRAFT_98252 [Dacryopinax primogenitus]|uniref:Monopolin complex subunit Csm1/Pcs1 C-terminal domain-containing protein n=1 Tax=Dacryopinax primogenitus (strain DJM 731) TaxID=1858805 RepID=M5GEP0_DACPD|nr:uncharacterized protein DACRYDRAFT_98252 [Dacryopinax primogenitus]EJU05572.1 hypothetical protein DACRYDRAFT_98252 [Dacryopinax primogenitus]
MNGASLHAFTPSSLMDSDDDFTGYGEAHTRRPTTSSRPTSKSARPPAATNNARPGPSQPSRHVPPQEEEEEDEAEPVPMVRPRKQLVTGTARKTVPSTTGAGRGRPKHADSEEEEEEHRARPNSHSQVKVESDLRRKLDEVTKQRDTYAQQFDELVRLKGTEQEKIFADYKRAAEDRAKDQARLTAQLQQQIATLQEANRRGHTLPIPLVVDPTLERRREQEREEWEAKEREWVRREEELKTQLAESQATLLRLREDRPIQPAIPGHTLRAGVPPSTPSGKHGAGPTKNSIVVCLYEDLTNLLVTKCTIEMGQYGEEHNFVCVLTSHGKSLQFSLRTFRVLKDPPEPKDPYNEKVIYNPLELDKETDREWVERLDFLRDQFTFDREQMNVFLATAHNKMDWDETKMEEEDD